ncbi:MAG: hypothetical protein PVH54_09740 [Gammaproteobacteria bacterium]
MKLLTSGVLLLFASVTVADVTTEVFGEIYVIHDPDLSFVNASGTELDYQQIWYRFRNRMADYYDVALFFVDQQDCTAPDSGPCKFPLEDAGHSFIYNQTRGIGVNLIDHRSDWAPIGDGRLKGKIVLPSRETNVKKILHEMGHQWLAHVNYRDFRDAPTQHHLHSESLAGGPAQVGAHWGSGVDFDVPSVMGGLDWFENEDGTYSIDWHFDEAYPRGYSSLDLYLMGLTPPTEVHDFRILVDHGFVPSSDPDRPLTFTPERVVDVNVSQIIYEELPRNPDYLLSQRVFHVATILVTPNASVDSDLVSRVDEMRKEFTKLFREKTGGRAVVDTSLLYVRHQDLYFAPDKIRIIGTNPFNQRFRNVSSIWVRNQNDYQERRGEGGSIIYTGDEHQDPVYNKNNYLYARVSNRNTEPYRNVTVNCYADKQPSMLPRDDDFVYPLDWHPDSLIGSSTLNIVPGLGSTVAIMPLSISRIPGAPRSSDFTILCEFMPLPQTPSKLHHAGNNNALTKKTVHFIGRL